MSRREMTDVEIALVDKLCKEYELFKAERSSWESYWEELAKYVLPMKNNVYGSRTKGEKLGDELFDSTGIHANELLGSSLHSMLTNPSTIWMWMTTGDNALDMNDDVRSFIYSCVSRMHNVLNNSNFQSEVHEMFLDEGCFGTGDLLMESDPDTVVRFNARPIYESCIGENARGIVDKNYRVFKWAAETIVEEWGEENLPLDFMQKVQDNPRKEFEILHCIRPRKGGKDYASARSLKQTKFMSVYILKECKWLLEEGGYYYFPHITPRWSKLSGEVYGRSPAMKCLPEIKLLNEMNKNILRADQLNLAPPLLVPDDGYILPIKLKPFGFTFYRAGTQDEIKPLLQNVKLNMSLDTVEMIRQRVSKAFFIDQLQLRDGPQMTATEVMQRTEESLRTMSPMLGRQDVEFLKPLAENLFSEMNRRNLFEKAPEILRKKNISFVFNSAIAKAQLAGELNKIQRAFSTISGVAQAKPEMLDYLDSDQLIKHVFNFMSVPQPLLNTDKKVQDLRTSRAKAQEAQMKMQQEAHAAEVANKTAPAMSMLQGE